MINIFRNKKGFNLIEMMVALGVLSLIIIGLVTFFSGGTRAWVTGQYQLEAQRNARYAMDRMVREIRESKNITNGSDTSITVGIPNFNDIGEILDYNYVVYELDEDETTIQRDSVPLIDNVLKKVNEAIFRYYDSSGNEVVPPVQTDNEISKIHINLKVDVDNDKNPDITLNTDINLRNFNLQE